MSQDKRGGHRQLRRGRRSEKGQPYLLTTATINRRPVFGDWNVARTAASTITLAAGDAEVICWVLMPDHLHIVLKLTEEPLAVVASRLKSRTSAAANKVMSGTGPLWQRGYHDRAIRNEAELISSARYAIANPVRAGLVKRIGDYPYWDANWVDGELVF